MKTYSLIDYFDVLSNGDGTWEVNNLCTDRTGIVIADDAMDEDIIEYLKRNWIFSDNASVDNVEVEWMDDTICELTERATGRPLCRLVLEQ